MAEALGRNPCLCLYPREQPAQILCARNVPLSLGQSAHGACAQLLHRRCFGQGQENAGLQRPAPHRLGRLRPACRKRCHQAQYPPCQLDLFQHCQHARPDEAPWLQLRLGKRARHLPSRILPLGTALLSEAKEIGILPEDIQIDLSDYESVRNAMSIAYNWEPNNVFTTGMDKISLLQSQLSHIQNEIDQISIDIRNTEEFLGQVRDYSTEVEHQKSRLESIGLFEQIDFDPNHCPLCSKTIDSPLPGAQDIRESITSLSHRLESVSHDRPALREHLDQLKNKRQDLVNQSQALQVAINAIYDENKEALRLKDLNVRRGRVVGRISLWLESVVSSDNMTDRRARLSEIESRINEINSILDINEIEERKESIINRISALMYQWAKSLDLEHSEFPYRFDLTKLTVMVDRDRPVPLQQLGSGSNWLGCHLITLFALHTFFIQNKRPVPGFLFLDQPSQVYFPPETNDQNVDSQEVRRIYDFVFERIKELDPNMQVIIVDHADINEKRFQNSVVEKWWDGTKLVPLDWA